MRRLLTPLLLLGLLTLLARGDDKPAPTPASTALAELKKSYTEAKTKYGPEQRDKQAKLKKMLEETKDDEEKKDIKKKLAKVNNPSDGPGPAYSLKFLAFAQQNAKDNVAALESLKLALAVSGGPFVKDGPWDKIIDEIHANYVTDPEVWVLVRQLARGAFDDNSEKLLREVISKNPDRKNQAFALKTLAITKDLAVKTANNLKDKDRRENAEDRFGKDFVVKLLADADKNRQAAEEARKTLKDRYKDVFPDLVIGTPAPEVISKDLDGKEVRLSALKGKVVVLDIWATWCPPCRAMIPHEREMVETTFKDQPFVLVSISADAEKKTLTDFLATNKMPWTHWYNGAEGGIIEAWDVGHFPTIYVLDAKGIIRFKEIRGKELQQAVEMLLKEAAAK